MEYLIERLSAQNISYLGSLYRKVFNRVVSNSFFSKKYDTKNIGVDYVGFIAITPTGIVAAYYGVIPCHFLLNGKTVVAAQSADTMTHPDFQRRGLFQLLAKRTYHLARELNIHFIFGFPNQDSYPGFVKLGWNFLPDPLQVFSMKTGAIAYAAIFRLVPFLTPLYNSVVARVLGNDRLSASFFDDNQTTGVKHDDVFCSYKSYYPTHLVTLNGVTAWVRVDGVLKVGAVRGINKNNAQHFLMNLKAIAAKLGCSDVTFITSKYSPLYNAIAETLTPRDAFPTGYLPLQEDRPSIENVIFEYCDIDIF